MKVLVLSQQAEDRKLIQQAFKDNGNQLVYAANKEAVFSLFRENTDVVVFADFDHPKLNGLDLINHILAMNITTFPFIVFLTDLEKEAEVSESLGPVPGDTLRRPISPDEVYIRLRLAERTLAMQKRMQANAEVIDTGAAKYDELTNVLNRQAVYEQALAEMERAQREGFQLAVAMVEVLNLEKIYNEYGADVRDQVVQFIARAARANLRMYDLVGRWIGAKFLLVLPGLNEEMAGPIFNRIHLAMTTVRVRVSDAKRIPLEVRIGYTITEKKDPSSLYIHIEQANQALKVIPTDNLHSAAKMFAG